MKSNLFKSLLAGAVVIAGISTASAQNGDGTAASTAYTVCPTSAQFKLTTQQNYPSDFTFAWSPISGPSGTASTVAGSGSGTINGVYTVAAGSGFTTGDYSYELEVISASGCKTKDTFYVRVIDTAITIALGSGTDDEYCEDIIGAGGEAITLEADITGTTEEAITTSGYAWTKTGTATVLTPTDAPTTTGTVPAEDGTYTFGVTVTFNVDVAPVGGCKSAEATKAIIVNPRPVAPSAGISGS